MTGEAATFGAIKAQLIDRTGHHYYADKDVQLRDRIGQRMAACGAATLAAYLDRLSAPQGEGEWRRLESAVTINETFFFRFAEQFAALREHILPALIAARAGTRRLRIWSAGCSTGAEPYSLAVLVHDLLGDRLRDWAVSILGTDIDETALEAAREGRFGSWALRSVTEVDRDRLFIVEGRHWTICPHYRGLVRFERHNLLTLETGGALQFSDFDLVLCRNVLIYFSAARAQSIATALAARVAGDGWLLVGHAEPGPSAESGMRAVQVDRAVAWCRHAAAAKAEPPPIVLPIAPARPPVTKPKRPRAPRAPAADPLVSARLALDAGLLDDALAVAGRVAARDPLSADAHYLEALALAGLGRPTEAASVLARVLYLDPDRIMAQYLRAVLLTDLGRGAEAARALRAAGRLLEARPRDEHVAGGDGLTVADLTAAIDRRIGVSEGAAA